MERTGKKSFFFPSYWSLWLCSKSLPEFEDGLVVLILSLSVCLVDVTKSIYFRPNMYLGHCSPLIVLIPTIWEGHQFTGIQMLNHFCPLQLRGGKKTWRSLSTTLLLSVSVSHFVRSRDFWKFWHQNDGRSRGTRAPTQILIASHLLVVS